MTSAVQQQLFDDTPTRRDDLARDDSGAIMVIGVFMAFLVTGFLYYVVGIGNTLIYRERLQDAADAIAFSGAVVHARGMNIIAMINIVLLVLMTVYLALWVVERAVFLATIIATLACAAGAVPACALIVPLERIDSVLNRMLEAYSRGILQPALLAGHTAQETIRTTFPAIAQGRVLASTLSGTYSPPASSGLLLPVLPYRTLPVVAVKLDEQPRRPYPESPGGLCFRAANQVSAALTFPLSILGSAIRGAVANALSRVVAMNGCPPDRPALRNYDLDIGSGDCNDGYPGQDCEYSQLRGIAFASTTPFSRNERGVNVATLGRGGGGGIFGTLEPFTRVGLAQAEYYYDGTEDRDQWMWHMYWRARFRRVRLGGAIPSIPGLSAATSTIDRIITH